MMFSLTAREAIRRWPAMGEVEKFDRVEHRIEVPLAICAMQPMFPVATRSGEVCTLLASHQKIFSKCPSASMAAMSL